MVGKGNDAELRPIIEELRAGLNENDVLGSLLHELASQRLALQNAERRVRVAEAKLMLRDLVLPNVAKYAGVRRVQVDAGMPLRRECGFYAIEYDALGKPRRWTGPDNSFYFDINLDRSIPLRFILRLTGGQEAVRHKLRCFTDNIEIPLEPYDVAGNTNFEGVLFPREILGVTRLCFVVHETSMLLEEGGKETDARRVGVMFVDLLVEPVTAEEVETAVFRTTSVLEMNLPDAAIADTCEEAETESISPEPAGNLSTTAVFSDTEEEEDGEREGEI